MRTRFSLFFLQSLSQYFETFWCFTKFSFHHKWNDHDYYTIITRARAGKYPGPGPVNTGGQGRQTQTGPQGGKPKLGPTSINTNWGPGPANTNWEIQKPLANFKNLQIWILSAFDLVWIDLNFVLTGDLSELSTSFRFWTFQDVASTLIYELGHEHLHSA